MKVCCPDRARLESVEAYLIQLNILRIPMNHSAGAFPDAVSCSNMLASWLEVHYYVGGSMWPRVGWLADSAFAGQSAVANLRPDVKVREQGIQQA